MKFWKAFLPNLTISLALATLTVVILNSYNPMMGFLAGTPFSVLLGALCLCAIVTAALLYADWRKKRRRQLRRAAEKKLTDQG